MKLSVCVVTYNGMEFIDRCLSSILKSIEGLDAELIAVDNASTDGTPEYIAKRYPQAKLIVSKRNLGYAGGACLGYRHSKGDYFILVNQDVEVEPDWAKELIGYMDARPEVAIAGCTVKAPIDVWNRGTMNVVGDNIWEAVTDVPFYVAGVCMVIRKSAVEGEPFDGDYFLAAEDVYACWLARLRGFSVGLAREAVLHHLAPSLARDRIPAISFFFGERNRVLNLLIFYDWKVLLKLAPLILFSCLMKGRLNACFWLLKNWGFVLRKRRAVQAQRRVSDSEVTCFLTSKLSHHNELLNALSRAYLKIVGVRTLET